MEKVNPNWSGEARLPQTIRLPVQIANAVYGIGSGRREIVIRKDGEVPSLIIEWMHSAPQYRAWFLADKPKQETFVATLQTGEAVDEPRQQQGETLHDGDEAELVEPDKPKRQRRKKSADEE